MNDDMEKFEDASEVGKRGRSRKRHTTRNVLLGFLAIFLVAATIAGIFVFNVARSFDSKSQKIAQAFPQETLRPVKPTEGPAASAMNILLLGSDSRVDSVNMAEAGVASDQRSDTMMWVHIPADHKNIYVMSIMRDTWVDIPGHGQAKINAALAFGGIPLVVQTLEGLFGNRVDHVAVVDFEGFKSMTEALGGVTVDVPQSFTTGQFSFYKGPQILKGDQALAFVRERHAFADQDYQRVKDQQVFLKAVLAKFLTAETLANPARVSEVVNTVSPYISVDKSLDAAAIGSLALQLKDVRPANVVSFTLPNKGTGWSPDGQQSIVIPDNEAITSVGKAMGTGQLGSYLDTVGLLKGN